MGQIRLRVNELIKARELREGRRIPREEITQATGVATDTIRALETNTATTVALHDLSRLCDYFNCTAGMLLYYDVDPDALDEDEIDSRDIVARWEGTYGADEQVPR